MHRSPVSLRRSWIAAAVLAVLAALLAPTTASAAEGGPKLTVMTRNLYLGSGLTNLPGALSLAAAAAHDWANVVTNDFPTRAQALADEIVGAKADVVALQEVTLWRTERPSDLDLDIPPDATNVAYDYLALLQGRLAALGSPYLAVATSTNVDAEAPMLDLTSVNYVTDLRLTDRDVILVRAPLAGKFSTPRSGQYATQLVYPATHTTPPISFLRGWTSIDYHHDAGTTVRIFDTHLEAEDEGTRFGQAQEFLGQVAASPYPVIVLGDFNAAAGVSPTYALLTSTLTDAWVTAGGGPGLSCCQQEMLDNATSTADQRIDLVLTSEKWPADRVALTGSSPFRSSPAPLWASDHFGVTARLELQR